MSKADMGKLGDGKNAGRKLDSDAGFWISHGQVFFIVTREFVFKYTLR